MRRIWPLALWLLTWAAGPVRAQATEPPPSTPAPGIRIRPAPARETAPSRKIEPGRRNPSPEGKSPVEAVERGLSEAAGLIRQGKLEEAIELLQKVQAANPEEWRALLALGRTLEGAGRQVEARELFRRASTTMADARPALNELQRLQRAMEDWAGALDTCLEYLERFGDEDVWVADEVESLVRTDRVGPQAIRALEKAHAVRPEDQRLRELLVIARLHQGEADQAIADATALDRERNAHGAYVIRYARLAQEKGLFLAALQGFDRVLALDPPGPVRDAALLGRARALRDLGRLTESLAGFDAASCDGTPPARAAAWFEKAKLLAGKMRRPEEALAAYRALLDELRGGDLEAGEVTADQVRLAMADLRIRLEQPGEAAIIYRALADSAADTEVRAEALYHAGEMLFYQGKLQEAQDTWYEVTDNYPRTRWVNDALAAVLMVGEKNDEGGIPLTAVAQAMFQRRLGRVDRGMQIVDEAIGRYPQSRAGDCLREERVLLLLDLGKIAEARAEADSLATKYPESALGPRAFLAVADRLAAGSTTEAEAEAVYLELLTRFPEALEASQARAALQKARDRSRSSSVREPVRRTPDPAPEASPSIEHRG